MAIVTLTILLSYLMEGREVVQVGGVGACVGGGAGGLHNLFIYILSM